jgi:diphthamide biosynthesis protein 3
VERETARATTGRRPRVTAAAADARARARPLFLKNDQTLHETTQMAYDEVEVEDMAWDAQLRAWTYQCPCGDLFSITPEELIAGETVARCPSCSLFVEVVYDPDHLPAVPAAAEQGGDGAGDAGGGGGGGKEEEAGRAAQPPAPAPIPASA